MNSTLIFCTANLPLARAIQYFTVGYGHAAFVITQGKQAGAWIDARAGGVAIRAPERDLHSYEYVRLPYDIEPGMRQLIGRPYNYRGVISQALHFRWNDANGIECGQALLMASRLVGHPVCDTVREDKVSPIQACDMFKAYVRGSAPGRKSF